MGKLGVEMYPPIDFEKFAIKLSFGLSEIEKIVLRDPTIPGMAEIHKIIIDSRQHDDLVGPNRLPK